MKLTRRELFASVAGAGAALALRPLQLQALEAPVEVGNPLEFYPSRDWEAVYREQYRYDSTFTYVCSPNDTHECRVKAYVRNGIVNWVEQNYDHQRISDLEGNRATPAWNPRMCLKGYTITRRIYGPYRLKYPIMRRGWKQWADDGFPELNPQTRSKYKFDARGQDSWDRISWDKVYDYIGRAMVHTARTYSGEEGRRRLLADGYPPEMLDWWQGAGTRTMKFRGGMGLLGVIGKYGMYRFSNMMALLDTYVRKVPPEEAKAGRNWSNYTWHGDQAPGHPFVHGLQASDVDFNDLRFSKLHIQVGKNLIENKMPESHWFHEVMERGGKVVVVAPEYNPPAAKCDYWLPVRPGSDAALFLSIARVLMDKGWYDKDFVRRFTDLPLLVRTDTLKRLKATEVIPGYKNKDISQGPSMTTYGLTPEQREKVGDCLVWDSKTNSPRPVSRDDVGAKFDALGLDPALEGRFRVRLADGKEVEAMPLFEIYKVHLKDYDLDSVAEMTGSPKELIELLAKDMATMKPVAIHHGEGVNHYFHATEINRAFYLPIMLTGNIGKPGAGVHTWAGNYKAALFQGSKETGPGFKGWVAEDPFHPNLDPNADGKSLEAHAYFREEEVGYWGHSDRPLIVNTPKYGRRVFTGKTHLPTPTKFIWSTNVNLINNAKWAYQLIKNSNPLIDCIITSEIEVTASVEYSDIALPANSWLETETQEVTASCSNPFLQIWKGGVKPIYETKDDTLIMAEMAVKLAELTGDNRFRDYWKFALEKRTEVYIQRLLDSSTTGRGYKVSDILEGKYGEPGAALMLFRTYPRIPFYEQVYDSLPFFTPTGRLQAYNDEDEVIEYGENFIVHREPPEATPYLPNVIVSANPYIRPDSYGFTREMVERGLDWESRHVANLKLDWRTVKGTKNPLWARGFNFYCVTPKSRHTVHSSWTVTDWNFIWSNNFGDPYRMDKRAPGVGDWQLHINPQAAKDLGLEDGDYAYVDADPANRPYIGWKPDDPFYRVARCMVRVKYNPAYPYNFTMMKHASFIATEHTVKAHETRPDGLAQSAATGYQASFRYGSQQSITISWLMPMHQLDSFFHKSKAEQKFVIGYEADNHAINSVPKETLVRITKAENGGLGGKGVWLPATTGYTPGGEDEFMKRYLQGDLVKLKGGAG